MNKEKIHYLPYLFLFFFLTDDSRTIAKGKFVETKGLGISKKGRSQVYIYTHGIYFAADLGDHQILSILGLSSSRSTAAGMASTMSSKI